MGSLQESIDHVFGQLATEAGFSAVEKARLQEAFLKEYCEMSPTKHYELLGRSSLHFVTCQILCRQFSTCSDENLAHMLKLLHVDDMLVKAIGDKCGLQVHSNEETSLTRIVERLIGVITQSVLGQMGVTALVTPVMEEYQGYLFSRLPRKLRMSLGISNGKTVNPSLSIDTTTTSPTSPIARPIATPRTRTTNKSESGGPHNDEISNIYSTFTQFISKNNGETVVDFAEHSLPENRKGWACRIAFKLTGGARWLSHTRVGQTKKRAKTMVVRDIVEYYRRRPEQEMIDKHLVVTANDLVPPDQAAVLPVPEDELHSDIDPATMSATGAAPLMSNEWHNPVPQNQHLTTIHIGHNHDMDDEDYKQLLSNALFGMSNMSVDGMSNMSVDGMETEEDRCRTKKRPRALTVEDLQVLPSPPADPNCTPTVSTSTITPNCESDATRAALKAIRRKLDISKVERMLLSPNPLSNPKSSLFPVVCNIPGLEISSSFEEQGPAHDKIFNACTTITYGEHRIPGYGQGSKKSEAEQSAIISLMKTLVA